MLVDNRFRIGKTYISATNPKDAIEKIEFAVKNKLNGYICVSNVRMIRYANQKANRNYLKLMKNSLMNLPDGRPLTWCGKLWGLKNIKETTGPQLFDSMLKSSENNLKHFLLGDTQETLDAVEKKYSNQFNTIISGTHSPPFTDVDKFDYKGIAKMINKSGADVVWVSMRSPKQDYFNEKISPLLENKICIGVGRAFLFSIGRVKQAPKLIQAIGLSGLFVRRVSFKRIFVWYITSSFQLLYYFIQILYWRISVKEPFN